MAKFPGFHHEHELKHEGKAFVVTEEICMGSMDKVAVVRRKNGECVCDGLIGPNGKLVGDLDFVGNGRKSNRTRVSAVEALEAAGYY